uniref:Phage Tail Collar Domain n=1 Tax=Candidatus Kentrum sp. LPFa TaxID=2126335 RepID=A0A450X4L2_9GAMM|nr:MAG: hypothetical protein BECKLPF1236A_GA0070988_104081 [Candidatus Kentron sp. LPFa]VFK35769.1 MAG: hypothetical protein BECKLPF1236C_GA0070990_104191 [Candidatus Kentron sp. LPFa]
MKKHTLLLPILLFLLPVLTLADTSLDYCNRQLEQEIKTTYGVESLNQYQTHLRDVLRYSRPALQDYGESEDGSISIPLPMVRDILSAEKDNRTTRELVDNLRHKYRPSPEDSLRTEDFDALAPRILDSATAAEWEKCKATCSACLANASGRQNGIAYRVHGDTKDVFGITFTYLPDREDDPRGIEVTRLTVTGGAVLHMLPNTSTEIGPGKSMVRYNAYTQHFRRTDPKQDAFIRVNLKGRENVLIRISQRRPEAGLPVGTVLSSVLPWKEYAEAANDNLPFNAWLNYWAPCDGRTIEGYRLRARIGKTQAPDLRGVFLRGRNRFDDEFGVQRDPKGLRPAGYDFQNHKVGKHDHRYYAAEATNTTKATFMGDEEKELQRDLWYGKDYKYQSKWGKTHDDPEGETRPKNIPMNYYIKIN